MELNITQIDDRGQIVIPKLIREKLGINEKSRLEVFTVSNQGIFLKNEKIPQKDKV